MRGYGFQRLPERVVVAVVGPHEIVRDELRDGEPEGVVGFLEYGASDWVSLRETLPHTGVLRALAGKQKGDLHE